MTKVVVSLLIGMRRKQSGGGGSSSRRKWHAAGSGDGDKRGGPLKHLQKLQLVNACHIKPTDYRHQILNGRRENDRLYLCTRC